MKATSRFLFFALLASLNFPLSTSSLAQGSLAPPAAPAPTMKTLDQVEPRIPVDAIHTPQNATYDYVISQPGSYYLTGNIDIIKGSGIQITVGDVTLDLNGFELSRTLAGGTDAINISAGAQQITIRNGSIKGFTNAVNAAGSHIICDHLLLTTSGTRTLTLGSDAVVKDCKLEGGGILAGIRSTVRETVVNSSSNINVDLSDDARVIGLTFNTNRGELQVGTRSLIADSQINAVGPPTLIVNGLVVSTGDGATVRHCSISAGNIAGGALQVGAGSLVTGCRILQAFRDGIASASLANVTVESCSVQGIGRYGITLGAQARVRDCTLQGSGSDGIAVGDNSIVSNSTVAGGQAVGIAATNNCSLTHCVAEGNAGDGIQFGASNLIQDNNASGNTGDGLHGSGSLNRIDSNLAANNSGWGVHAGADYILRNTANGNHGATGNVNYNPSSGTNMGPRQTAGNTTSPHPFANFE